MMKLGAIWCSGEFRSFVMERVSSELQIIRFLIWREGISRGLLRIGIWNLI
jgi:hypothetical protein